MVGDETIGYGSTLDVDDGVGDSFVAVGKIVSWNKPSPVTGMVESKRLDLDNRTVRRIPALKTPQDATLTIQSTHAGYARMEALRDAQTEKRFQFTTVDDDGDSVETAYGIITQVSRGVVADEITDFEMTVAFTGRPVS